MTPVHVLDKYYLAITLLVTVGYQLSGFAIAWTLQAGPSFQLCIYAVLSFSAVRQNHGFYWRYSELTYPCEPQLNYLKGSNFFLLGIQHLFSELLSDLTKSTALLTLLIGQTFYARNIVASVLVMIWATRLAGSAILLLSVEEMLIIFPFSGFLLFRVLKTGSDTRFDDIRSHFFKFFGFWVGQIVWVR